MKAPLTIGGNVDMSELNALLHSLAGKVRDFSPVFRRIDAHLTAKLVEQFAKRGAALGTPWAPITAATQELRIVRRILSKRARARARTAPGKDTPLWDSGGLRGSFVNAGGPNSVRVMKPHEYRRGSSYAPSGVPVARLMQDGFKSTHRPVITADGDAYFVKRKGGPKQVAPRPILPQQMPAPVLRTWEGYLASYLESRRGDD